MRMSFNVLWMSEFITNVILVPIWIGYRGCHKNHCEGHKISSRYHKVVSNLILGLISILGYHKIPSRCHKIPSRGHDFVSNPRDVSRSKELVPNLIWGPILIPECHRIPSRYCKIPLGCYELVWNVNPRPIRSGGGSPTNKWKHLTIIWSICGYVWCLRVKPTNAVDIKFSINFFGGSSCRNVTRNHKEWWQTFYFGDWNLKNFSIH